MTEGYWKESEIENVNTGINANKGKVGNALGGAGRVLLRNPNSNRRLAFKCSDCGGKPLCLATIGRGCALLGKRRLTERQDGRGLTGTSPCASQITAVDAALNATKASVSAPCQALLNAPRDIQCAEYTYDCDIYGFTAMKSLTQAVITKLNMTGTTSICMSSGSITIRADTNFFLGSVNFTFTGKLHSGASLAKVTKVEAIQPYLSFGKIYTAPNTQLTSISKQAYVPKPQYIGRVLYPGVYTVSAFSQDNPTQGKTATFTVKHC